MFVGVRVAQLRVQLVMRFLYYAHSTQLVPKSRFLLLLVIAKEVHLDGQAVQFG